MWPPGAIIQLLQSHWKLVSDFLMGKKHTKRPKKCVFCPKQVRTRSRLDFFPKKNYFGWPPLGGCLKILRITHLPHESWLKILNALNDMFLKRICIIIVIYSKRYFLKIKECKERCKILKIYCIFSPDISHHSRWWWTDTAITSTI